MKPGCVLVFHNIVPTRLGIHALLHRALLCFCVGVVVFVSTLCPVAAQEVFAWGSGHSKTPVPVSGLTNVLSVSGGTGHSLALKSDGTAWAWGGNWYGELGDGTTTWQDTPVPISSLTGIIAVSAGSMHSFALNSGGAVWRSKSVV